MAEALQPPDSEMPRRKLSFSDSDGLSTSTSAAPERMQAFVRLRPLSGKEARATIATTETDCTISLNKPSAQGYGTIEEHSFSFDGVFGPDASQPEVYEAVMRPQVQALLEGRDTLTFAYGITNAGKTYTVQGGAAPEQRGVLPRALCSIFGALDALRAGGEAAAGSRLDPSCSYKVAASFLEIYGAEAHDLLAPAEKAGSWWQGIRGRGPVPLRIKEGGGKVSVDGLKEAVWADLAEALAAVEYGWANRQSASNGVNDVSSRSHAVLSIKLLVTPEGESKPKVTRLTVVDLAGAEKQKLTQSSGERLNEANAINKDLMVLGHCLRDLRWNQSHPKGTQRVPPYRNSRITMLFRDFLSGSGQTVVIAALNPRAIDAQSTLETLRFASVAQQIKTKPAPAPAKEAPAKEAPKRPAASQSASERTSDGGGDAPDSYVLYEQVLALQERLQQLEAERLGDERRIREEVSAEMQQHMEEMHESLTHSNQEQLASTEESYHKKMLLHKGRHEQSAVDGHVEMQKQHRDSARKDMETLSRISSTNAQLEAARAEVQRLTAKLAEAGSAGGAAAARPEPDTLRREAAEAVEARQLAEGAQAQAEGALQVAKADAAAARATATAAEARATAAEGRAAAAEGRAAELEERCAAAAGDAERVGKKLQAAEAEAAGLRAQIATLPPVMPPPLLVASSSESGAQVEPRPAEAVAGTAAAADRVLSPKRGLESSINRAAAAAGGGGASPAKKARGSFRASEEEEEEEGGGEAAGLKPKPSKLGGLLRNLGGKGKADGSPSVEQLSNFFGGRSSRASTSARASFRAPSHRASTREPEAVPEAAPEPEPAGAKSKLPEPTPISKRTRSSRRNAQAA